MSLYGVVIVVTVLTQSQSESYRTDFVKIFTKIKPVVYYLVTGGIYVRKAALENVRIQTTFWPTNFIIFQPL